MSEWLPILLMLVVTGAVGGILAGLLGVGGGIVIVPVLFMILQSLGLKTGTAISIATATSLMTIVPTSVSSAHAHHKRGNIDFAIFRLWMVPLLVGVVIASLVAANSTGVLLGIVFGIVAMLVASNMLFRASAPPLRPALPAPPLQAMMASAVGFFSVLMGVGAGTLGVPLMTAFNVSAHRAVGTAALFGLLIALPSSLILLLTATTPADAPTGTVGLVNVPAFLAILPTTTLLPPYGVKLGAKLDATRLKQVFAAFLVLVGARMLWQSLTAAS